MAEPASRWRVVEKVLFAFGCMAIAFFCGMIVARARVFPYPEINAAQEAVKQVQVSPEVASYIVDIARATRESPSLSLGVSPRGATALLRAARAWAWLSGRDFATPDDVKALAHAVLVHRLGLRPEAELEGVDVAKVLSSALGSVPVPR